jgi:hypothetical protein
MEPRDPPPSLTLFADEGYRFNDILTDSMSPEELHQYLLAEARTMQRVNEFEVAYQILRELVWRFPGSSPDGWELLSEISARIGKTDEAAAAQENARILAEELLGG